MTFWIIAYTVMAIITSLYTWETKNVDRIVSLMAGLFWPVTWIIILALELTED